MWIEWPQTSAISDIDKDIVGPPTPGQLTPQMNKKHEECQTIVAGHGLVRHKEALFCATAF